MNTTLKYHIENDLKLEKKISNVTLFYDKLCDMQKILNITWKSKLSFMKEVLGINPRSVKCVLKIKFTLKHNIYEYSNLVQLNFKKIRSIN